MKALTTFPSMEPMTSIDVSENAILHNVKWIQNKVAPKKILAMLKSNAYGHGLLKVANLIKGKVDAFGVARTEDAVTLRSQGIATPILIMGGVHCPREIALSSRFDLSLLVHCEQQLEMLMTLNLSRPLSIWLEIDLGMNRLGFHPRQTHQIISRLTSSKNVKPPLRIMGHFSNADQTDSIRNLVQKWKFEQYTSALNLERSLSNSAAIVSQSQISEEWVRTGLLVYGVSPISGISGEELGLKPAMNFDSKLIEIRACRKDALVSYHGKWRSPIDDCIIGVVGAGYGDGMPRSTGSDATVLIRGRRCRIVGNVCMNMFMVDLTQCPGAEVGDHVRIWGAGHPVENMADWSHTIPNQLLVSVH